MRIKYNKKDNSPTYRSCVLKMALKQKTKENIECVAKKKKKKKKKKPSTHLN